MKLFRYFSIVPLVIAGLFVSAPPAQAAKEEGRFHLVYLVAAVDLKPGSKVTVDPVFFTDGKDVMNFHDFCRNQNSLKPEQVAADRKFVDDYCGRKTFTFDPKGHHTLNNHGQRVTLDPVEFKAIGEATIPPVVEHQSDPEIKDVVMMGHAKVASYSAGTVEPPKWLRNDGAPEYFFLMSRNKQILEQIVPVSKTTQAEVDALTNRALEFSKVAKWRMAGSPVRLKDIEKARLCYDATKPVLFRMENPLVVDLDVDGTLDLVTSVYVTVKLAMDPEQPLIDCFTNYRIYGNGEAVLAGSEQIPQTRWSKVHSAGGVYNAYLRNGYAVRTMLMLIKLGDVERSCAYMLDYSASIFTAYPEGLTLSSANCKKSRSLLKQKHPSSDKPYHTLNGSSELALAQRRLRN